MGYDDAALGALSKGLRQYAGNVFVGQSVKTVTAQPQFGDCPWQRQRLCNHRLRTVECRIEAGNLREFRAQFAQCLDGCKVVRLVKWCQRCQSVKFRKT